MDKEKMANISIVFAVAALACYVPGLVFDIQDLKIVGLVFTTIQLVCVALGLLVLNRE